MLLFLFFIFYFTNKFGIFDPKRIKISLATATNLCLYNYMSWWYTRLWRDDIRTFGPMIYNGKPLIFYLSKRQIKKTAPNMETEKQLYHPFTYPPICAQDYGRAPSLITVFSQARLGSDIRAWGRYRHCHGSRRLAHTPYRDRTVPDSLCLFCAATVFVTVFRFFTYRFYYKDIKMSIVL